MGKINTLSEKFMELKETTLVRSVKAGSATY